MQILTKLLPLQRISINSVLLFAMFSIVYKVIALVEGPSKLTLISTKNFNKPSFSNDNVLLREHWRSTNTV
jgi:hypothetical protein